MVHSGVGFTTVKYPAEEKGRGKRFHTGQCLSIRPYSGWVGHISSDLPDRSELKWGQIVRLAWMFAWRSAGATLPHTSYSVICEAICFILFLCAWLLHRLFSICLPTLTSPSTAAPQSLHPSLQCWIIETDWSSCSQLCVRVERDRRERRRQKRGRYGGQAHPCLKRGFCREPQAGCQVCRPCTSGRFLSLWKWVYARADVPSLNA